MCTPKSFFDRQLGLAKWNRYDAFYNCYIVHPRHVFNEMALDGLYPDCESPVFACTFSQSEGYKHLLALASETGTVAVVNMEHVRWRKVRVSGTAHNNAIFDLAWMPSCMKLVTVSGDHTASLLDVGRSEITVDKVFVGHTRSVKTISCRSQDSFATGGRDGKIILWDVRQSSRTETQSAASVIPYAHCNNSQLKGTSLWRRSYHVSAANSVTGLAFQDSNTLISCGSGDGFIKVWDMRKSYYAKNRLPVPKYVIPYPGNTLKNGFSNLQIDYDRNILYASCLDNNIYAYHIGTFNEVPFMKYFGHKNRTFYIKMCLGEGGNYLLSGSSDNKAYIWHRSKSNYIVRLVGHDAEVTSVAWSDVNDMLVTCSDDIRHKFWTRYCKDPAFIDSPEKFAMHGTYGYTYVNPLKCTEGSESESEENQIPCSSSTSIRPCGSIGCKPCQIMKAEMDPYSKTIHYPPYRDDGRTFSGILTSEDDSTTEEHKSSSDSEDDIYLKRQPSSDGENNTVNIKRPRLEPVSTLLEDLPNFNADGKAPHINTSPVKQTEIDWLTKLRLTRASTSNASLLSKPSCSYTVKPSAHKSPARKPNTRESILYYFKVSSSPTTGTKSNIFASCTHTAPSSQAPLE